MDALISNVRMIHPRSIVTFKTGQNFHYELKKGNHPPGLLIQSGFFY